MTLPQHNPQPSKKARWFVIAGLGVILAIGLGLSWSGRLPGVAGFSALTTAKPDITSLTRFFTQRGKPQGSAASLPGQPAAALGVTGTPQPVWTPTTQQALANPLPEVVTVITMTPTPSAISQPTWAASGAALTAINGEDPEVLELKASIRDLLNGMLVTLTEMEAIGQRQPTAAELTVIRSQVEQFSSEMQAIQERFVRLQADGTENSALPQPQASLPQALITGTPSADAFKKLQEQMLELQRQMAAMGNHQAMNPTPTPTATAGRNVPGTPTAAAPSDQPTDPHNHSTAPGSSTGGAASDPAQAPASMAGMPCMGDQNSQSSGASPVITSGPLAKTIQTKSFSITAVPLTIRGSAETSLDFYIAIDSTVGDFRPDLINKLKLRLPDGKSVQIRAWTGPLSGTHIEGTLSFAREDNRGLAIAIPDEGYLSLDIGELTGFPGQVLAWDLSTIP